jgi:beta-glucanase (GH16 family)
LNEITRPPSPWRGLLPAITAVLTACGGGGNSATAAPAPATPAAPVPAPVASAPAPSNRWTLVWSDEFNGAAGTVPNPASWNYDLGNKEADGWGNHELEYYTSSARNAQQDGNGMLVITAEKATNPGPCWNGAPCGYTSARIHTSGKVNFTYGKVEARMKLPAGAGIWPAFWSLGQTGQWPASGELDIMEFVGKTPNTVYGTAHGTGYSGAQGINKPYNFSGPVADDFHTYTLIKRPNEVIWQVDGVEYHRITPASLPAGAPWVFEKPFFVILNLAIGGDWPGSPDSATVFPAQMKVDWVRVYKED